MTKRVRKGSKQNEPDRKFAEMTAIEREEHLIRLAEDLAYQQLRDGTASSQVITQYLKLGSSRERIEQRNKELEGELLEAKTSNYQLASEIKELYTNAIEVMRSYQGVE